MISRLTLVLYIGLLFLTPPPAARAAVEPAPPLPAPAELLKLMRQVNDWQLAHPVMKPLDRNWERGTWYTGVMAAWKATGDGRFLEQAIKWGQLHRWQVGQERNGANNLFCVQTWLETYLVKRDPAMTSATLHWLAEVAPFAPENGEKWNVAGDRKIYSDSLYGASALAMLSRITGDPRHLTTMHEFFWSVTGKLFDKDEGLYYRDMSFIGKRTAAGGKILWSRGNGWVFGGIARILDYLPADDPRRPRYINLMQTMAAALAQRQGADGLWRPNLGDPAELPMPETSGTGFFCYGMAWGINHGVLDRATYLPVVLKAWAGLRGAVTPEGKVLWGQQVDAMPHAVKQESTHEYVTGTFLLAASELYKLAGGAPESPANPAAPDPKIAEEFRARGGLPNFFAKLAAGETVRIAYLGGSITAANGWRPKTFAWFKAQYPNAKLIEINAAISGTGSDYGACRVAGDVLAQDPDLVFMEHRVNGGGGFEAKSVEGIVRQIWKKNPRTDICLIYTLSQGMLAALQAGRQPAFGAVMETVANAYAIPSIDLGVEIARREKAGVLIFKGSAPVAGKLVFSADGVHPGDGGHEIYREVIARSMLAMKAAGKPGAHPFPAPLEARCWEAAALVPIAQATLGPGWQSVDPKTDPIYRDDFGRTNDMLRGAVKCDRVGETIAFKWNGTTLGFSDIPQGQDMAVEVTIDNAPAPIVIKRPQTELKRRYARFFYLPEQAPGEHTAVLRVTQLPAGLSFYAGQILVIGASLQGAH